jgi:hypothetical protein
MKGLTFSQLVFGFFRRWHAAVADHGFGEREGGALVDVLAVDMLAVGEAMAARILDAPSATGRAPFDFGPQLPPDSEMI